MKKIKILWAVMCISFFYQGYTQSEPEKPVFEAIMFQDGSKIYVQRDLPIYLSVSTTKDGKGINLETPANPQDGNPMFLDTEGVNYFRSKWAIDKEKQTYHDPKREILFPIYADGVAPKTKIFFKGAPEYIEGQNNDFMWVFPIDVHFWPFSEKLEHLNGNHQKIISKLMENPIFGGRGMAL